MHRQRIVLMAIASLGVLSAFMPWFTIMIIGVSGIDLGRGWIALALFGIAAGLILIDEQREGPVTSARGGAITLLGLAAAGFGVWQLVQIKQGDVDLVGRLGNLGRVGDAKLDGVFAGMFDIGYGLYALIGTGVLLAVVPQLRRRSALLAA